MRSITVIIIASIALFSYVSAGEIETTSPDNVINEATPSSSAVEKQESKATYFGVDQKDVEAVKKIQQELSHQKFKELFGDSVNIDDINFHESSDDEKAPHVSLIEKITTFFNSLKPASGKD